MSDQSHDEMHVMRTMSLAPAAGLQCLHHILHWQTPETLPPRQDDNFLARPSTCQGWQHECTYCTLKHYVGWQHEYQDYVCCKALPSSNQMQPQSQQQAISKSEALRWIISNDVLAAAAAEQKRYNKRMLTCLGMNRPPDSPGLLS